LPHWHTFRIDNLDPSSLLFHKLLTCSSFNAFYKVLSLLLVYYYLLLQLSPGGGAVFVVSADYLMDGMVYLPPVFGSNLDPGLAKDIF